MIELISKLATTPIVNLFNKKAEESISDPLKLLIFDDIDDIKEYLNNKDKSLGYDDTNDLTVYLLNNKILHVRTDKEGNVLCAFIHNTDTRNDREFKNKIKSTLITSADLNIILNDIKNNYEKYILNNIKDENIYNNDEYKNFIKNIYGINKFELVNILYDWITTLETDEKYKHVRIGYSRLNVKIAPFQFIQITVNAYGNDIESCELNITSDMTKLTTIPISGDEASIYIGHALNNEDLYIFNTKNLFSEHFKSVIKELHDITNSSVVRILYIYIFKIKNNKVVKKSTLNSIKQCMSDSSYNILNLLRRKD